MSFHIRIEPAGITFMAEPGERILEAALRQGVNLPFGCQAGDCGSCRGRILDGALAYPDGRPRALTAAAEAAGEALFCRAVATSDLRVQASMTAPEGELRVRTMPARIEDMQRLSHDMMCLHLKIPEPPGFRFLAGQYIEVLGEDGRRRGFSLANAPGKGGPLELHIRHVPGGRFTDYVFNELRPGAIWRIEGPLGGFWLRHDSDRPALLVGGGSGFAPLKGMLEQAFLDGVRRPLHLFWGAHRREDLYAHQQVLGWTARQPDFRYTPVLVEPDDGWQGDTGLVTEAVLRHHPALDGLDVYMSGPPAMIEAGRALFLAHGLAPESFFSDAFEFAPPARPATR